MPRHLKVMKKKTPKLLTLWALFALCSNGLSLAKEVPDYPVNIVLEEVLSIGTLEDDTLYMWTGVAADDHGNVYVLDAMDYSLKKFDPSGQLVKRVGRKGQGPGEFIAPRLLAASQNYLFTTDQSFFGIQIFDKDLKFVARVPLGLPLSDIAPISDEKLAVIPLTVRGAGTVKILNTQGKILQEFEYAESQDKLSLLNITDLEIGTERYFYLAFSFKDRIEKWSAAGQKIWTRSLLQAQDIREKKIGQFSVPSDVLFKTITKDSSERVYVLSGNLAPHPSRDVFVLNSSGDLLTIFTLPHPSHCIYIDSQDFLYCRANQGVTLKKYRMHVSYSLPGSSVQADTGAFDLK